jgi:ribosomal protein S18 acetylase RimI-like enzyme
MLEIRSLPALTMAEITRIATPYTVYQRYAVTHSDTPGRVSFDLVLESLPAPVERVYDHFDAALVTEFNAALPNDFSFGAYQDGALVGFLLARAERWNNSLWVMEFHVAAGQRRQGIGRSLMARAAEAAVQADLRVITCETQTANTPAIAAYRALGFHLEGIDISYYTNTDYPNRDVAVFMKLRLAEKPR